MLLSVQESVELNSWDKSIATYKLYTEGNCYEYTRALDLSIASQPNRRHVINLN